MFEKNHSLKVSENFFIALEEKLKKYHTNLNYYLGTFNNCREQGYMLEIYPPHEDSLCVWACECRNSDQIMVIVALQDCKDQNNMFDDKAFDVAKYYNYNDYDKATDYVISLIKKHFKREFLIGNSFKFDTKYSIYDIERICSDAENLDYEDYHDIATFENANYFCDLIILDGKLGLRYSKYLNDTKDDFDNVYFEEYQPNLTNEVTLMLGMKEQLENFIDKELEIEFNKEINI